MNVIMYRLGLLFLLNYPSSSIGSCSVSNLYSPEGMSVTLNMQYESTAPQDIIVVEWWNNELILTYYPGNKLEVQPIYKPRVKFDNNTFTLELMNLQKRDSGVYRGVILKKAKGTICAAEYNLSVVETVAAPVLTVVSNWSSSDSCNLTVTCRGHDLSLTFSCNKSECTQLGDLPITPNLAVFLRDGYIICNHSNQVSWHNVTLDMLPFCDTVKGEDSTSWIPLIVGLSFIVTICLCVFMIYRTCVKKKETSEHRSIQLSPGGMEYCFVIGCQGVRYF